MKKSSLNFLSKKTPNLFDTGVQIKHYENVDLVLDSGVIPESGTAKVRSRPTVKHFSTTGEALGFAVPTPTVPVLPQFNGPQAGHSGSSDRLSNGGMISVDDPEEGEILIPPPPSVAPPPPPQFIPPEPQYIPPPVGFYGNLMDPPVDLATLQPPPMAPPKPPSDTPSLTSSVPISSPINTVQDIPECPKFTPPLPPGKTQKTPPLKPVRLSSIYNLDAPPASPSATPASSFNPQTTAKLYSVPKTTVLSSQADPETRTQHILLLEDSSGNPVGVHINGKASSSVSSGQDVVPPVKPVRRNSSGMQLETNLRPEPLPINEPSKPDKILNDQVAPEQILNPVNSSPKPDRTPAAQELNQVKDQQTTKTKPLTYSPLLNHKLQNLRGAEGAAGKESTASPLALLKAAKEREKHRSSPSRPNSASGETLTPPTDTRPHSTIISPTPSTQSLNTEPKLAIPTESRPKPQSPNLARPELTHFTPSSGPAKRPTSEPPPKQENSDDLPFIPPPPEFANSDPEDEAPPSTPPPDPPAKSLIQSVQSVPVINGPAPPPKPKSSISPSPPTPVLSTDHKIKNGVQIKPQPPPGQPPVQVPVLPLAQPKTQSLPLVQPKTQLPAPPPTQAPAPPSTQAPAPPSTQPPAPPTTQPPAPPPTKPTNQTQVRPPAQPPAWPPTQPPAPPLGQPKTQPPAPPQTLPKTYSLPPAPLKTQTPAPPKTQTEPPPPSVSASQATLLSILQKKMLEMDPKLAPTREAESSGDDWNDVPTSPKTAKPKSTTLPTQSRGLDLRELENKVTKKTQENQVKTPSSNSKQQFGMTFTIRPGTKQPITPVIKSD